MFKPVAYLLVWMTLFICALSAPLDHTILDRTRMHKTHKNDADLRDLHTAVTEANSQIDRMLYVVNNHEVPHHKMILEEAFGQNHNLAHIKANVEALKTSNVYVKTVRGDLGRNILAHTDRQDNTLEFDHNFYTEHTNDQERAGTVIHEAAHAVFDAHDHFHKQGDKYEIISSSRKSSLQKEYNKKGLSTDGAFLNGYLTGNFHQVRNEASHLMHQNADSYAHFGYLAKYSQPGDKTFQNTKKAENGHNGRGATPEVLNNPTTHGDHSGPSEFQGTPHASTPPHGKSVRKPNKLRKPPPAGYTGAGKSDTAQAGNDQGPSNPPPQGNGQKPRKLQRPRKDAPEQSNQRASSPQHFKNAEASSGDTRSANKPTIAQAGRSRSGNPIMSTVPQTGSAPAGRKSSPTNSHSGSNISTGVSKGARSNVGTSKSKVLSKSQVGPVKAQPGSVTSGPIKTEQKPNLSVKSEVRPVKAKPIKIEQKAKTVSSSNGNIKPSKTPVPGKSTAPKKPWKP